MKKRCFNSILSFIMLKYIIRRIFYSIWVISGVLLLTFALFNLASGDPAGAVLGKNAAPEEIEAFRRQLGSDLPMFFGYHCRTAAFGNLQKSSDRWYAKRLFPARDIVAQITYADGSKKEIPIADDAVIFELPLQQSVCPVQECQFFRRQRSPWNSQFFRAVTELVTFKGEFPFVSFFNFGETLNTREAVTDVLKRGIWPSLCLMLPIFTGELLAGIFLALIATAFAGKVVDRLLLLLAVITMSMSYLVTIIFGQWFLGYYWELFPVWGYGGVKYFVLPVCIGIICGFGSNLRFFRTVYADELQKEYLRTAFAKGVAPVAVYSRHLLRNAMIQIITKAGAGLPFLFTGSLLLESFFGIPGLGFAGMEALMNSDIQLLKALVLLSAVLFVIMNLLTDIAYAWADPRIKLE